MTLRQEEARLETERRILAIVTEKNRRGGASIGDFADTGRSVPQVRVYLRGLLDTGVIERNQLTGPGTRYFLAGAKRPRYYAVVVDERDRELGRVELPSRLADEDGASERRTVDLGRQLGALMRKDKRR